MDPPRALGSGPGTALTDSIPETPASFPPALLKADSLHISWTTIQLMVPGCHKSPCATSTTSSYEQYTEHVSNSCLSSDSLIQVRSNNMTMVYYIKRGSQVHTMLQGGGTDMELVLPQSSHPLGSAPTTDNELPNRQPHQAFS